MPQPPAVSFASDNAAGTCPAVLDAIVAANGGAALAYGDDPWTRRLEAAVRELFDAPVEAFVCWGGTGANVVGLGSVLRPWEAVLCADAAHIYVDEGGAPSRFTGAMLVAVPTEDGKLSPDAITEHAGWAGVEHHPQIGAVSLSQVTEMGTVHTPDEIAAVCDAAHRLGARVHVDGARIANAVAPSGCGVVPMLRDTGVDVMTFGVTKNGAMYGEVVVFLEPELAAGAAYVRKQAAQLPSKARFVSAQVLALLEDDLWLANAAHANAMAARLAATVRDVPGVGLVREPEANSVFAHLADDAIARLQDWSFFWTWDAAAAGVVRWMTSFATTAADVDAFAAGVEVVCGTGGESTRGT